MSKNTGLRAAIYTGAVFVILLIILAAGYFIVPSVVENRASAVIEEKTGFPAKVEITVPFSFILTGRVSEARIYMPVLQLGGLNLRQFELKTNSFRISPFALLFGNYESLKSIEASGTLVITPEDLNNYLKTKNQQLEVEIADNELYLSSYLSGVGKVVVKGRLVPNSSGASFQAENLVQPRLPSLVFYPQLWSNLSFSISVEPLDKVLQIDRYFIDKKFIRVYFSLKKEFLEDIENEVSSK